jgi:hypothetical protein
MLHSFLSGPAYQPGENGFVRQFPLRPSAAEHAAGVTGRTAPNSFYSPVTTPSQTGLLIATDSVHGSILQQGEARSPGFADMAFADTAKEDEHVATECYARNVCVFPLFQPPELPDVRPRTVCAGTVSVRE